MSETPDYEPMLAAYHRAFAPELRAMVATLPAVRGQCVLDMACGDGAYTPWLAELVAPDGCVMAADVTPAYLKIARHATSNATARIGFAAAAIERLPFGDDTFDLCWCAQSLYSLADPADALRHLRRVTKPGGAVAVLEQDTLHAVMLPWPVEVELAVRTAELRTFAANSAKPRKFYVGRRLRRVFRESGFAEIEVRSFVSDRVAPLRPDERTFFTEYLQGLSDRVARHLTEPIRRHLERLADPRSGEFLLDDPDLTATCISHVARGSKPRAC